MNGPTRRHGNGATSRLVIVGGGVAALEAMLALRELAGERVEVELHTPERVFAYRPLVVGKPFGTGKVIEYDLDELARRAGAAFYRDSVVAIEPDEGRILTHEAEKVPYDYLLLCPGVEPRNVLPGTETFWGTGYESPVVRLIERLRSGGLRRVVFAIPGGATRSLPIYELALMAAADLAEAGVEDAKLTVVSPEDLPLGIFGAPAGEHVRELLSERGIEVICGAHPVEFGDRLLHVTSGDPIEADAVISAPQLEGRRITGAPCDESGFVDVDEHNRVVGLERVFAAGDVTTFPVKQGGIATQQADTVAEAIAADMGLRPAARPFSPILRAVLWTGAEPQYLYGVFSGGHGGTSVFSEKPLWEREGKIVGEHLAPFLDSLPGVERPGAQTGVRPDGE